MIAAAAMGAVADPLKAVTELLGKLGETLKNLVLVPLQNVHKAFEAVGNLFKTVVPALEGFQGRFRAVFVDLGRSVNRHLGGLPELVGGYLARVGGAAVGALGAVGKALGGVAGLATVAGAGVGLLAVGLAEFVRLANPAVFEQFQLALRDLMGVIGQALVPVFQNVVIPVIGTLRDAFTALVPVFHTIAGALAPLVKVMTDLLGEVLVTAFRLFAETVKAVMPYLLALGRVMTDVFRTILNWAKQLLAFLGVELGDTEVKKGAGVGAAARQASHMDVQEALKQAQRASFSLGTASKGPAEITASAVSELNKKADHIYNIIAELPQRIWNFLSNLPGMVYAEFNKTVSQIGDAIDQGAKDAANWYDRNAPDVGLTRNARRAGRWFAERLDDLR